jgi:hypothetical protein
VQNCKAISWRGRSLVNRGYRINPSLGPRTSLARREKDKSHTQTEGTKGTGTGSSHRGTRTAHRPAAGSAPATRPDVGSTPPQEEGGGAVAVPCPRAPRSVPPVSQSPVPTPAPRPVCDECHSTGAARCLRRAVLVRAR